MTDARLRVGDINAPERTDPSKRNLLAPAKRAIGILRWRRQERVSVLILQETGKFMRLCVALHPRLRYSPAPPNTVIRGHELGNAIVTDRRAIKIRDKTAINVPLRGRKHGLWLPVRLLEHTSGALFVVIGVHKATRRTPHGGPSRAASDRLVSEHANAAAGAGFPVVIGGDWNGAPPRIEDFKVAVDHGVDTILTSTDILVTANGHAPLRGLSDHEAIYTDLAIPVRSITPKRLPKP